MSDAARLTAQRAAAEYLRQLLLKPGAYRASWQGHVVARSWDGVINQLAIAEIIASHLTAGHAGDAAVMPYQLRDLVSGALSGSQLSAETLEWFIEAFRFSEPEAGQLRRLLAGSSRIEVLSGTRAVTLGVDLDAAIGPRQHQTLSLHDHLWVGPDGRLDRARTLHVIEAIAPAVDRIPVVIDTNVLTLEVGHGCKEVAGQFRSVEDEFFVTEILLSRTLDVGETLTLEYWLSYRWAPDDPSAREYRCASMRQLPNLDIRVEFHPECLPDQVWWAQWDGSDGHVLEREPATLDSQHAVHRYLRSLEKTVAGFYWECERGR
jgi:hypothetical protein